MKTNLKLIEKKSPTPIRQYAQDAVDALRTGLREDVLIHRMAALLLDEFRMRNGLTRQTFAESSAYERQYALILARALYKQTEQIDTTHLPTPREVVDHKDRRRAALSRATGNLHARQCGHNLGTFIPGQAKGYEMAVCLWCGQRMSVHLETGALSISNGFNQPCRGKGPESAA